MNTYGFVVMSAMFSYKCDDSVARGAGSRQPHPDKRPRRFIPGLPMVIQARGNRTTAAKKAPPPVHRRGGILGRFPAAFLGELEQHLDRPIGSYFDLVSGTSTGGIIGGALALGPPASAILGLYEDRGRRSSARIGESLAHFLPRSCGTSAGFTETSTTRTRFGMPSGISWATGGSVTRGPDCWCRNGIWLRGPCTSIRPRIIRGPRRTIGRLPWMLELDPKRMFPVDVQVPYALTDCVTRTIVL